MQFFIFPLEANFKAGVQFTVRLLTMTHIYIHQHNGAIISRAAPPQSTPPPLRPALPAYGSPWIGDGLSVFLKSISSVHFTSLNITAGEAEAGALWRACLPLAAGERSFWGESNLEKVTPWDDVTCWKNTLHNLTFFTVSAQSTEPSYLCLRVIVDVKRFQSIGVSGARS